MVTLKPPCSSWSPSDMILLVFVLLSLLGETLACPASCTCKKLVVRCGDAGLTELPSGLPSDTRLLDLSDNSLSQFAPGSFGHLPELTTLVLKDNRLTGIPVFDSRNSRLEKLILAGNQITVLVSSAIAALTNLKRLDLRDNNISHLNGASFPRNNSVDTLVLSENKISRVNGSWLTVFPRLKSLKLNKNSIGSLDKFPALPSLQTLDLSNNQIGEVPSLVFKYMISIKVIKLNKNGLTKLHDGSFFIKASENAESNVLEEIHLEHNALTEIGEGEFFGSRSLKKMYVNNNKIARVQEKKSSTVFESLEIVDLSYNLLPQVNSTWFSTLESLKELRLDHNNITSIQPNSFIQCSSLTTLSLNANLLKWRRHGMDGLFRGLVSLNYLNLEDNRIESVRGSGFEDLGSLQYLDLRQNPLSMLDESVFKGFRSLQRLYMNSTSLSCDCHLAWFPLWIREKEFTKIAGGFCKRGAWNILHVSNSSFSCANHPWIADHPQPMVAIRGQNVTFRCRADSRSSSRIQYVWIKDDQLLISDTVLFSNNSGHSTVTLLNVDFSHTGEYQCAADNGYDLVHSNVAHLTVYEFPYFTEQPKDADVHEGNDVSIHCQANGHPEPKVKLTTANGDPFSALRERRISIDEEGQSFIRNVSLGDSGRYYCNATNSVGTILSYFRITVRPRLPVVRHGPVNMTVVVGQSLVIQCDTTRLTLQGAVTWYKGTSEEKLQGIPHIKKTKSGKWLVFSTTALEDSGHYRCQAPTSDYVKETEYHVSVVQSSLGSRESESMGDSDVTWIIISVVCGVVFACACWVIGFIVYRIMRHPRRVTRKPRPNGTSVAPLETVKPRQATNGHARLVIAERELEEGSSGSGGVPVRIVSRPPSKAGSLHQKGTVGSTPSKAGSLQQNGTVGSRPTSSSGNGSCRPVVRAGNGCVVKMEQNHSVSHGNEESGMNGTNQIQTSAVPHLMSTSGAAPCIMVLSPDGSFQPLATMSDSNRHRSVARAPASSCDSDSDVD